MADKSGGFGWGYIALAVGIGMAVGIGGTIGVQMLMEDDTEATA